jgi:hypothetical protein
MITNNPVYPILVFKLEITIMKYRRLSFFAEVTFWKYSGNTKIITNKEGTLYLFFSVYLFSILTKMPSKTAMASFGTNSSTANKQNREH